MASLLPLISADEPQTKSISDTSKLYREIKWDPVRNAPVWRGGNPVWVTGAAAVRSWILMALYTRRGEIDIFSPAYGCDIHTLIGQPFSEAVRNSEASRMIRECLLINPYITEVRQASISFADSAVRIGVSVGTIYGEVTANVSY